MSRYRVALYSHDTVGLGHTRRQLAIAGAISRAHPDADLLLVTGNPEATQLPIPERTDLVTLPTVTKDGRGAYVPRRLGAALDEVLPVRRAVLTAALTVFDPHLLIVDKVAEGLRGELREALARLRGRTRIVLGLREILDAPAVVHEEWRRAGTARLIREAYDEVWVYGDPRVFDPVRVYGWDAEIARRTHHVGYLGARAGARPATSASAVPPRPPYVLCQLGGGADASALARAVARCALPPGWDAVILTGPYLPTETREQLRRAAVERPTHAGRLHVHALVDNGEDFLAGADAVVSMAGYNTAVEVLGSHVPALLVPRVTPRREQWIRAERLAATGSVDVLPPSDLTSARLSAWLDGVARAPRSSGDRLWTARNRIDLNGLERIVDRTQNLLEEFEHAA